MDEHTPTDPLSTFSISVFTINGLLMRSGELVTKPLGQSSARWQLLGRVGHKPQTVSQMARDIGNSRQSVQRIADALEKENLVEYIVNPTDKRADLVKLTKKGAEVLASIYQRDQEWSQDLMIRLDEKQLRQLAKSLDEISIIIKEVIEKAESRE